MDVDIYEIFNYIKDNSDNKQELADNMNSLIMATDRSKFNIQLNKLWSDYSADHNICECCGEQIVTIEEKEPMEYFGFPTNEIITYRVCPNCG